MITRRKFLRRTGLATTALLIDRLPAFAQSAPVKALTLDPNSLAHFVDPLPIPPVAKPDGYRPSPTNPAVKIPYFRQAMRPFETRVHRDLKPTRMWGFSAQFPGPTFDVRSGQEILVEWANELPDKHFLPIDHNLAGAGADQPEVRTVVHLHGGKAPPESDGYPEDWIVPGKSALYHYPNNQDAAMLWYHDHAMGINRLNIFAGLAGLYFLRDDVEDALHLPNDSYEVPLVISDRFLTPEGQLFYPVSDKANAPWVPEAFGDTTLVNGRIFPYLEVAARKYRFRVLNASNARFYHLSLENGATFSQIGTDQGLLPAPVPLKALMIAPGERVDLVVDFGNHRGERIILKNDAFVVMQFRVSGDKVNDTSSLPGTLRPVPKILESQAVKTRLLSLDQYVNRVAEPILMLLNGTYWHQPITENPVLDTTEIWTLINPTDDSHPIHLHLVRFQILDRHRFETSAYMAKRELKFTGEPEPPDASEAGWKDTVRAQPGMVTRIIVHFEGYAGRYVWHCHILEHEDNEMMRPYQVLAKS
ncbi:MAG TPA: multicopper oxidase [Candidatus Acidoferrales bacterium]|nr:multicopper oxidase [Candidatus Acidoferrales bacterium]